MTLIINFFMFLNKNQEILLIEIAKQKKNKSITSLGKKVYNTYISAYNNVELLKLYGYVDMYRKKNKIVVELTDKGRDTVELILSKREIVFSVTAQ